MKHCPWCGDNRIQGIQVEAAPRMFVAMCMVCGAKGPPAKPIKKEPLTNAKRIAINLWNLRFDGDF